MRNQGPRAKPTAAFHSGRNRLGRAAVFLSPTQQSQGLTCLQPIPERRKAGPPGISPHQKGPPAAPSPASLPRRGPSGGRRPHHEHTVRPSAALSVPLSGSQPAALCIPRPSHFLWPTAPETRDGKKTETRCQGLSVSAPRRATQESHGGGTGVEAPGSAGTASRPRETQVCLCGHALGLPHA